MRTRKLADLSPEMRERRREQYWINSRARNRAEAALIRQHRDEHAALRRAAYVQGGGHDEPSRRAYDQACEAAVRALVHRHREEYRAAFLDAKCALAEQAPVK